MHEEGKEEEGEGDYITTLRARERWSKWRDGMGWEWGAVIGLPLRRRPIVKVSNYDLSETKRLLYTG